MWKRAFIGAVGVAAALRQLCLSKTPHAGTLSSAVNSMLLRSLKEYYLEVAKMTMPPIVGPPDPFTIAKGALDSHCPVLKRSYGDEEISICVTGVARRMDDESSGIYLLFLHVDVSKPGQDESSIFQCRLYKDALEIHSVSMRPKGEKAGYLVIPTQYVGPNFEELDERTRDAFHNYIEKRGVNGSLFKFLRAWLYGKGYRSLMRWFKTLGLFIDGKKQDKDA